MIDRPGQVRCRARLMGIGWLVAVTTLAGGAWAQEEVGRVTLMAGTPRMLGAAIRPLQAVLSGRQLETSDEEAIGLLVEDIVFHVGGNAKVTMIDEPGRKRAVVESGLVVFYADSSSRTEVVVETPFGKLTWQPGADNAASSWFSVKHEPEVLNVSPAVSTFSTMEGTAQVEGTAPVAGPFALPAGNQWRIVGGQVPGNPMAGDGSAEASRLREFLHRQAAEVIRTQTTGLASVTVTEVGGGLAAVDTVSQTDQAIVDQNAVAQNRVPTALAPPIPFIPPVVEVEIEEDQFLINEPVVIPAGGAVSATAGFVSYAGTPADPNFNDFLTAVDGNPAFLPSYLVEFANGGFSYIQLAGADVTLTASGGEQFLATQPGLASGWATFTPLSAIGDAEFDAGSPLAAVVNDGFAAIANGEHLAGGGNIGGNGDPNSAFALESGGNIVLNPNQPAGYPLLDRAADTTGLTVGGVVVSDQIAALGAGRNPVALDQAGPQLVFLSNSDTDALGNRFNFDGDPIVPTNTNLPADRTVQVDNTGAANTATPLAPDGTNTVGVQFAGTGDTIAIIHHTGVNAAGAAPQSEHFEVVRGARESVVQWRDGGRVTGGDGQVVEAEDLNDDPALRNELFSVLCQEVNQVVPADRHTVCGPALAQPGTNLRRFTRTPGRLVRTSDIVSRHAATTRRLASTRSAALRRAVPATNGRLVRDIAPRTMRQHIGRVTARK